MLSNLEGKLSIKTIKEKDGISFEFSFSLELPNEEISKLREFREEFAKTSSLHFQFENENFSFTQKKYFKKKQYIKNPPILDSLKEDFLKDIKTTLQRYNNFLEFEKIKDEVNKDRLSINITNFN